MSQCPGPTGRHERAGATEALRLTSTPEALRDEPGIRCGQDVLAVLCEHAGTDYPTGTYTVRTPSGGLHLYFTAPLGIELRNSTGKHGWLIDTRAHGGYVVAAGTTINNRRYTVVDDTAPAPLPAWLHDRLTADEHTPTQAEPVELHTDRLSGYLTAALRDEARRIREAPEGQRNACLYMAAQTLGQLAATGALDPDHIRAALLASAEPHLVAGAYTRREAEATITSGLRAGVKRPRQVAA